jgi:prepilin-type N-terminal cleavage/methylation domain-containing protein
VSTRANTRRLGSAFTLVELLVVMVVIGILAGVVLGALGAARETARVAKTKATIAKLDKFVAAKYESFLTRRLPVNTRGFTPKQAAAVRLLALRDLIRMEMPERFSDITRVPITRTTLQQDWPDATSGLYTFLSNNYTAITRPSLSRAYKTRYDASDKLPAYESAECLYMIVTVGDPEARSQFGESEVGDADGDRLPEFHDAWGNPIQFFRWAPAFTDPTVWTPDSSLQSSDAANDHDPFDPYQLEIPSATVPLAGLRLVPLIYSPGPDGIYGLSPATNYAFAGSPYWYVSGGSVVPNPAGGPLVSGDANVSPAGPASVLHDKSDHLDNIHNHRLEVR